MISFKDLQKLSGDDLLALSRYHFHKKIGDKLPVFEIKYQECLRYLYLLSKYQSQLGQTFMPLVGEVDDIWHFLIIQTREYQRLCMSLPGKVFLHHRSILYEDYRQKHSSREESLQEMLAWIPLYCKNFGKFSNQTGCYWKIVNYLHKKEGMSYADISELE